MEYDKCPICDSPSINKYTDDPFPIKCYCYRCGNFQMNESGVNEINKQSGKYDDKKKANISGWIREHQGSNIILTEEKLKSLMTLKTLSVSEKADKILKYLAEHFPVAGMEIHYSLDNLLMSKVIDEKGKESWYVSEELLPIFGVGYIISSEELHFIWKEYLITTKKFISSEQPRIITPAGWAYLESLRQPNPDSNKAFVAMWFEPEMEEIYDGFISKAINEAGYDSIQIGRKEHNNDINDEIIGEIRSSKFVIADFTGNRGGVYYETGFAYGLNIPVIYTCKKDQLKNVHFDVNHRNIIVWENGEELYERLLNRINSTIT